MALLELTCKQCQHVYYKVAVECNRDGVDTTCPNCGHTDANVHVKRPKDGSSPFAGCKHL